jgi:hypothetical protein
VGQFCGSIFFQEEPPKQHNSGGYKKTTIGNTDYCQFTTLVNSASTAPPISLLPKGAKFCHTLNILLVGRQRCRALLRLNFDSSAVG